jgi:hypothetical protein
VKAEYYVQGGETKRLFRVLGLAPGDGLKLSLASKESGVPTLRLGVIPAGAPPLDVGLRALLACLLQAGAREAG